MNISDLKPKQGSVELTAEVVELSEVREFSKFGKPGRVATATVKDSTGSIKLTLWNEQIDTVSVGSTITIKNGYVNEWQGEMQLTTGKMGTLEVVTDGKAGKEPDKAAPSKKGTLAYDLDAEDDDE